MIRFKYSLLLLTTLVAVACSTINMNKKKDTKINALIIDGQSKYHQHWKTWTPILLKQLDESNLFTVDVYTAPAPDGEMETFSPKFDDYDVVISLYDGELWPSKVRKNFNRYVSKGGGLVVVHAADNAFPEWEEYNRMIGLGGWSDRDESHGPYVYLDDKGEIIRDKSKGKGGHHGPKHQFPVVNRKKDHPIMRDIPETWMHAEDELYEQLRGPAEDMEILATAYASPDFDGSGRHEPVIFTVTYGEGSVFHTTLGHDTTALSCVGFLTTFIRGCEWAARGKVTFPVPADFPDKTNPHTRAY